MIHSSRSVKDRQHGAYEGSQSLLNNWSIKPATIETDQMAPVAGDVCYLLKILLW